MVAPPAVITGLFGTGFTVTFVAFDVALHAPLVTVTEYDPAFDTVIDGVVAPVDHTLPVALLEVNVTDPP